jgi:hypothetical protein
MDLVQNDSREQVVHKVHLEQNFDRYHSVLDQEKNSEIKQEISIQEYLRH